MRDLQKVRKHHDNVINPTSSHIHMAVMKIDDWIAKEVNL